MRYLFLIVMIAVFYCTGSKYSRFDDSPPVRTEELTASYLDSIEHLFKGVPQWLTTVYDKPSGGFYHNALMVEDTLYGPDLQSTRFALHILDYGNILSKDSISDLMKKGLEDFVKSRYDPKTGYYLDPPYRKKLLHNERALARAQGMASQVLNQFEVTDDQLKPFTKKNTPKHLSSLKQFKIWFHNQEWSRIWKAFDRIAMQSSLLQRIPPKRADSIAQYVNDYVKKLQDDDGLWGKGQAMEIRFSGAAKYGTFCMRMGISMPRPERIHETVMQWFRSNKTLDFTKLSGCPICVPRNALRLLYYIKPDLHLKLSKEDRFVLAKRTFEMLRFYHYKDGGFTRNRNRTSIAPDDIMLGDYNQPVSDMNGTNLAITARGALYAILQKPVPRIKNNIDFQ